MSAGRLVEAGIDASPHYRAYSTHTATCDDSTSVFKSPQHPGRFFRDPFSAPHSREDQKTLHKGATYVKQRLRHGLTSDNGGDDESG